MQIDTNMDDNNDNQGIFAQDDDIIMKNIDHRQGAIRRSSSYKRLNDPTMPSPANADTKTLYTRESLPGMAGGPLTFDDFKILKLVGRGTFGKVYLVKNQKNNQVYAMKSIRKDVVIDHEAMESLKVEKLILLQVKHPFIIAMEHVFAKALRIYFVMQFVQGGELFKHLSEQRRFSEERVRFYAA